MMDSIGNRLKKLRAESQLSQVRVAELIGVNKRQISAYETDIRQPSYDIIIRLANLYCVSTDYILGCQNSKVIDAYGLTQLEYVLISDLVEDMVTKNKKLEELTDKQ